jgi:hypothetical protein
VATRTPDDTAVIENRCIQIVDDLCPICRFSPWAYAPHSRITFKPASRPPED